MDIEISCKHCKQVFSLTLMRGDSCKTCYQLIDVSLKAARNRAKQYKRPYTLDENWIHEQLFNQGNKCWWTGQDFDFSHPIKRRKANPNVISIDRLNNKEGYTKENSVLCVFWFNRFKSNHTIPELNHILMGCVSAYAKLQQYFVPYSTQPINLVVEKKEYREQFEMPFNEAEIKRYLKWLDTNFYDKLQDDSKAEKKKMQEEAIKKILEDINKLDSGNP